MPQEELPLHLEGVLVLPLVGELLPVGGVAVGVVDVGVPHRARGGAVRLHPALAQTRDGGAARAVHVQGEEVVAAHARGPRAPELRDDPALQLEGGVGRVVGGGVVPAAPLVPALRDLRHAQRRHRLHLAEEVVEDVAPVREHVEDHPAPVLLAVVPRRPLRRDDVALEDPVAELPADGVDAAEEVRVAQRLQLHHPREPELVLHDAVLHPRRVRAAEQLQRLPGGQRRRLLAVDVLPQLDGAAHRVEAAVGRLRVEVDGDLGVGQRLLHVRRPARAARQLRELLQLHRVAAHEDRLGHDPLLLAHLHPALGADGEDGAQEVLVHSHPPGHAVHDDSDAVDPRVLQRGDRHQGGTHREFLEGLEMDSAEAGASVHCGQAPAGSGGASSPARGRVPSSSCRQCATSPAGP